MIVMSKLTKKTTYMHSLQKQQHAYEMLKRNVLAWNPDFNRLTLAEARDLREAEAEIERGEIVSDDEIDWDAD